MGYVTSYHESCVYRAPLLIIDVHSGAYFIITEEEAREAFVHDLDELYNEQVDGYEIGSVSSP